MHKKNKLIHFVGIGGIGMSGIATILQQQGYTISGCDPDHTQDTVIALKKSGCRVYLGNNAPECNDPTIDTLVYIPMYEHTITEISAEIRRAREQGHTVVIRAQMLATLMQGKYSIAVSGSHGKTTTSALIAHILVASDYDPTVVIGGHLSTIDSNAHLGTGTFFVAEADESDRSFLQLNPTCTLVTNIDIEHLETYKDLDDIKQAYAQFITNIPANGMTIMCADDKYCQELIRDYSLQPLTYGITHPADVYATNITLAPTHSLFTVHQHNNELGNITLPIAGIHNVYNALGAITCALSIGVSFDMICKSLATFGGIERRFSFHGTYKNAEIFDDYGHHPSEIAHVCTVARKRAKNNLIVIFQPHRYTRTQKLWHNFLTTFSSSTIDTLIITDIYSAGEAPIAGITSKKLVQELQTAHPDKNIHYIPFDDNFQQLKAGLDTFIQPQDLIVLLGAGKMHLLAPLLQEK